MNVKAFARFLYANVPGAAAARFGAMPRLKRRTKEIRQEHMMRVRESFSRKVPLLKKLCEHEYLEA